jgi:hypothetical protein
VLTERRVLLRRALILAWFTVGWNVIEGVVAISAAVVAGSRALLGFGLDSGVESLSATFVLWRLYAERRDPHRAEAVEQRALRLIGVTFFVLAAFVLRVVVGRPACRARSGRVLGPRGPRSAHRRARRRLLLGRAA